MSLYNQSLISGNDPLVILQGFNSYANDMAFTVWAFCIFVALFIAIYVKQEDIGMALLVTSFSMTLLSVLLWFGKLVPIYLPFIFLSLMVVGIFKVMNSTEG